MRLALRVTSLSCSATGMLSANERENAASKAIQNTSVICCCYSAFNPSACPSPSSPLQRVSLLETFFSWNMNARCEVDEVNNTVII